MSVSTHVLDSVTGRPAAGVAVQLLAGGHPVADPRVRRQRGGHLVPGQRPADLLGPGDQRLAGRVRAPGQHLGGEAGRGVAGAQHRRGALGRRGVEALQLAVRHGREDARR